MTYVKVRRENGHITEVKSSGHTMYADGGEDILCSALSTILQTAILGLLSVCGIEVDFKTDETEGLLELKVPHDLTKEQRHDADIVLETMLCGVSDLSEGYSDYINLEVK